MPYLLDTHSFLWFISGSPLLSAAAKNTIATNSENYISIVSIWEISIKASLNKLTIRGSFDSIEEDILNNGVSILTVIFKNAETLFSLPFYHKDLSIE